MSLSSQSRPKLASHARLHFDAIDKRFMLLFPEAAMALNETAPEILRLCDGVRTIADIVSILAKNFEADPADVQPDVLEFLESLSARGLVVEAE